MDAIEKIVEEILEKGKSEARTYEETEKTRIDRNYEEQLAALAIQENRQIEKNEIESKKKFKQKKNRQHLEVKQETLNEKQTLLSRLFKETIDKMNDWDQETFQRFMGNVLSQSTLSGDVDVRVGEYSFDKVNQEWLAHFNTEQLRLSLDDRMISGESGFVLVKEGIEYNFLFSTLVQEIQKLESYKIAELLFR